MLLILAPTVSAVSNIQHTLNGNVLTLTYEGTPPFFITIRGDQNIGQDGGYVWAKTDAKTFSVDLVFANNPSNTFYYGVRDTGWSNTFNFGTSHTCNQNNFKFAFVLLGRDQADISQSKIDKLNNIKSKFKTDFEYATGNLATADVSYPVQTMIDDGRLMDPEKTGFYRHWIANKFLESNPDEFDFIVGFTGFTGTNQQDNFIVDPDVYGIGIDGVVDTINNLERTYGFKQNGVITNRLKSVVYWSTIGGLDAYDLSHSNGLLHEVGHHWCCYVGDNFAKGTNNAQLEIIQQGIHFYRGLKSPFTTGTPMNSDNWVANGDGSYRRVNAEGPQKYHPFQLYFIGLLNRNNYDFAKKFTVYNAGVVGEDFNDQQASPYKEVSINDIIAVEGERRCSAGN